MLIDDSRSRLGGRVVPGLGDSLLGEGVAAIDDQAHAADDGDHRQGRDHDGLARLVASVQGGLLCACPERDQRHGNTRSIGMRESAVTVFGPTMFPMIGVMAVHE